VSVKGPDQDLARWLDGRFLLRSNRPATKLLAEAVLSAYADRLAPSADAFVRSRLGELAEDGAIDTFVRNLRALLLAPPVPGRVVTLRGAGSIARRVQDPLAELVKVEPRSIGVGQYQHDLDTKRLEAALDAVVEDAVAAVGADVNTASPALLQRVPGVGPAL